MGTDEMIEFDDPESSQDYLAYLASSRFEPAPIPYERFREEWLAFLAASGLGREHLSKQHQVTREMSAFAASTADLTPINIGRYVRSLEARQLRRASIISMLACLHSACSFAINRRYIAAGNPVDAKTGLAGWIRRGYSGRAAPASPSTLEDATVAELLSHLHRRSDSWVGHRLYALVVTGLHTGFRRTALLTIRREDIDLQAGIIHTAGKPFRIFDAQVSAVLSVWSPRAGCEWLFPGVKKMGAWTGGAMGDRAVDHLKAAGLSIGIKRVTFESLRRYWMRNWGRFKPSLMPPAQPAAERIGDPCGPTPAARTLAALEVELGKLTPKRSDPQAIQGGEVPHRSGRVRRDRRGDHFRHGRSRIPGNAGHPREEFVLLGRQDTIPSGGRRELCNQHALNLHTRRRCTNLDPRVGIRVMIRS